MEEKSKFVLAISQEEEYHTKPAFEESAHRRSAGGPEEQAPRGRQGRSGNFLRESRKKFLTGKREAGNISPCASRRRAGAGRGRKAPPGTLRTGYCGQKKTDKEQARRTPPPRGGEVNLNFHRDRTRPPRGPLRTESLILAQDERWRRA